VARSGNIFNFDLILFISMLVLMVLGVLFIYSSGINSSGELVSNEYLYQIIWAVLGIVLFFVLLMVDYSIIRIWAVVIYFFSIFLLISTLVLGKSVNGARSWLGFFGFGIQPSEFAKISTIVLLARYFENNKKGVKRLSVFLKGMFLAVVPMGFILVQPDLGTASVYVPIFLVIAFIAGVQKRYIFFLIAFGSLTILIGVLPVWQLYFIQRQIAFVQVLTNPFLFRVLGGALLLATVSAWIGFLITKQRYFYWIGYGLVIITSALFASRLVGKVLKDYQIMRLIVFIDPSVDPQGNGWNIIQSVTAVGSGGVWGKGYLQGTQSHYRFLPQQSTDFIFSILAEELGFFGSVIVIALFALIIFRGLTMIFSSKDTFGSLVISGVVGMFFFHLVVNIGMAIGIMPITGIPLFFLSYGGSSLWTALIGLSLIQNIYVRRYHY